MKDIRIKGFIYSITLVVLAMLFAFDVSAQGRERKKISYEFGLSYSMMGPSKKIYEAGWQTTEQHYFRIPNSLNYNVALNWHFTDRWQMEFLSSLAFTRSVSLSYDNYIVKLKMRSTAIGVGAGYQIGRFSFHLAPAMLINVAVSKESEYLYKDRRGPLSFGLILESGIHLWKTNKSYGVVNVSYIYSTKSDIGFYISPDWTLIENKDFDLHFDQLNIGIAFGFISERSKPRKQKHKKIDWDPYLGK
ncbi:MAG: hypothetical protein HKN22_07150 [Bacteroidia bacterium]|nr:hypothetical protein [Bacteroidia bacterium]